MANPVFLTEEAIARKIAPDYSTSATYEVGEIVLYDGVAYKCVTAITASEEWTAAHWTAATDADLSARLKGLKSDGNATDGFATDLLGKQVAISAMKYGLASTSATVKAADRTVTKVTLGTTAVTVTFPDADENGKTRDFLLRIDAANLATGGSLNITKPTGATIYGDAFPSPEATKQYLVAITETASNEFYVRTIEITISTEA